VTAELIDNVIYVKGDASSLETFLNLSTTIATQLSNQWFYIKGTSAEYGEVARHDHRVRNVGSRLPKNVTSHGTKTIDGTKVTCLQAPRCSLWSRVPRDDGRQYIGEAAAGEGRPNVEGQTATFTFSSGMRTSCSAPRRQVPTDLTAGG